MEFYLVGCLGPPCGEIQHDTEKTKGSKVCGPFMHGDQDVDALSNQAKLICTLSNDEINCPANAATTIVQSSGAAGEYKDNTTCCAIVRCSGEETSYWKHARSLRSNATKEHYDSVHVLRNQESHEVVKSRSTRVHQAPEHGTE